MDGETNLHTIIYLDQNYLSYMAKARLGSIKAEADAVFCQLLFDDLEKAVLADKITCPKSEFHMIEAAYDTRLEGAIGKVIDELARGLELRPWDSILKSQIEDAARKFLGKKPDQKNPWAIAFESDPRVPVDSRMQDICGAKVRMGVPSSLPSKVVQPNRQLKRKFVDLLQNLLNNRVNSQPADLSGTIVEEKKDFIERFMGIQALRSIQEKSQGGSQSDRQSALNTYIELYNLWERLYEIGVDTNDDKLVMDFAESELLNTPFIDIYCSILAVIATHHLSIKPGDLFDIPILATVLPYCDVTTTDKSMKEILTNILHFDNKYKAKIFSAKKADRLAFHKLVRALI